MRFATLILLAACTGEPEPSSLVCPEGGVLAAENSEATLPTCADVEQRYDDVLDAASACTVDDDCQILTGQCSTGLGGCYEIVSTCLDQGLLNELGALYASHSRGCVEGVCDCDAPPDAALCNDDGVCEPAQ